MCEEARIINELRENSKTLSLCNAFTMSNPLDRDLNAQSWNLSEGKLQVMKEKGVYVFSVTKRDGSSRIVNLFELQNSYFRELLKLFRPENLEAIVRDSKETAKLRTKMEQELKINAEYRDRCISEQKSLQEAQRKAKEQENAAYREKQEFWDRNRETTRFMKMSTKTYWILLLVVVYTIAIGGSILLPSQLSPSYFVGATDIGNKALDELIKEGHLTFKAISMWNIVIAFTLTTSLLSILFWFINPYRSWRYS